MIKVWVLIFYVSGYNAGGPATIDNLASVEECQRVLKLVTQSNNFPIDRSRCIEVVKVKP